jgi:hypothetical protein
MRETMAEKSVGLFGGRKEQGGKGTLALQTTCFPNVLQVILGPAGQFIH